MENMQNNSFATCGGTFFFDKPEGIKIIPGNVQSTRIPDTKREFMELKKQELLRQRFTDPAEKERDSTCVICGDKNTEAFIFPTCRMVHCFACEDCIPGILKFGSACRFPGCESDNLLKEDSEKTVEQHKRNWVENGGTTAYPLAIDLLTLAMPEFQAESVLLKRETTVTLKNIALSEVLLFKLLEKTKVVVGENVSVFGNFKGEDCIRAGTEFEGLCLLRPASFPRVQNNVFFMENIARMPKDSIKLGSVRKLELCGYAVNILPKLVLHEENEMEEFCLDAWNADHFSETMHVEDNSIRLGRVKKLELKSHAINILPKLALHEENVMEEFHQNADNAEHFSEIICRKNNSIKLGKVKSLELNNYSVSILPMLMLHEENEMKMFRLRIDKTKYVSEIIHAQDSSILLGKVKRLELKLFGINILPKLVLHEENVMEEFYLDPDKKEYVSEIIHAKNNSIWFGKVRRLELKLFGINCEVGARESYDIADRGRVYFSKASSHTPLLRPDVVCVFITLCNLL
ncbi:MAG: uncharacterized protein A8A55_2616 [Amphiamblys sp. WSBS2006]|nr:MAG: uncharacterized protein A8A55_2616 [Amphiamblys sp. WSBS2006]